MAIGSARLRVLLAACIGGAACALLGLNMALCSADLDLGNLDSPRRYWEDTSVAVKRYLDRESPPPPIADDADIEEAGALCRFLLTRRVTAEEIRPWQFWRTVSPKPFLAAQDRFVAGRPFEDQGRAVALALGYRLLGGIAPFLLAWLGVLACCPLLLWLAWELCAAGRPLAAAAFCLLLASSPFLVDTLSLPHSATGFYLMAVLTVTCVAVFGVFGRQASITALLVRAIAAALVFAACAICRSGTLLLFPGLALALALGYWRCRSPRPATIRAWLPFAGLLVLVLLPYLMARPAEHHFVWSDIWKGIGDFDRTKVHPNRDGAATEALKRAGIPLGPDPRFQFVSPDTEIYFRQSVLGDIRSDPAWFAEILARRAFATVTQQKLWPWTPRDGRAVARSVHPNEGNIDKYYGMTTSIDFLGYGTWRFELPISLLVTPFAMLLIGWLYARFSGRFPDARARLGRVLLALACPAVATIALPVLISTSGSMETQAFALGYWLAWALGLEELIALARRPITPDAPRSG